jgi:hypothetical protein
MIARSLRYPPTLAALGMLLVACGADGLDRAEPPSDSGGRWNNGECRLSCEDPLRNHLWRASMAGPE